MESNKSHVQRSKSDIAFNLRFQFYLVTIGTIIFANFLADIWIKHTGAFYMLVVSCQTAIAFTAYILKSKKKRDSGVYIGLAVFWVCYIFFSLLFVIGFLLFISGLIAMFFNIAWATKVLVFKFTKNEKTFLFLMVIGLLLPLLLRDPSSLDLWGLLFLLIVMIVIPWGFNLSRSAFLASRRYEYPLLLVGALIWTISFFVIMTQMDLSGPTKLGVALFEVISILAVYYRSNLKRPKEDHI